jgi:glucose-1-phosphate thymidylyltransferase
MLAGIKAILTYRPEGYPRFEKQLGNGCQFGLLAVKKVQPSPDGLAQSFILAEFIGPEGCAMILGQHFLRSDLEKV